MSEEIRWLVYTATFSILMWFPYVLNSVVVRGLSGALGYPNQPEPLAPWAARLKAAHQNHNENLVVFGIVVLAAQLSEISNDLIVTCCAVFFFSRLAYAIVYAMGIPVLRSVLYLISWGSILVIVWQLLVATV